jgi:hypothetical protein
MITVELATRLRDAGLEWFPRSGDRFVIPIEGLAGKVFVISEMTIEAQPLETGALVRFNGTTEWALDSIPQDEVIWLPYEAQLRSLLGSRFARLEAVPDGFVVVLEEGGRTRRHIDIDAERAYARALLDVLTV